MKKFLFVLLTLLLGMPLTAQQSGADVPMILIPAVENEGQTITVERSESAAYRIHLGMVGNFRVFIARDGVQVFYDVLQSKNGVIDLAEENAWLTNGSYEVWFCQTHCTHVRSWIGPIGFVVRDAQLTALENFSSEVSAVEGRLNVTIHWQDSVLTSWYLVWAGLSSNHQSVHTVLDNTWYRGSALCTNGDCRISVPSLNPNSDESRYLLVYALGWGAAGYTAFWSNFAIDLSRSGCPAGTIEFPPGTGQCIAAPPG